MSLPSSTPSDLPPAETEIRPRPVWPWIAGLLALVAAGICLYLAFAAIVLGGRVAGCGGAGGDCSAVLATRWARWFGLPVGLPAAVVYGAICAALWPAVRGGNARRRLRAWYVLVPLATLVLASASWFSALQLLAVGRVCGFCLAVHGCAILLAVLLLWHIPHDWRTAADRAGDPIGLPPTATLGLVLLGLASLAGVVVGQVFSKPSTAQAEIVKLDPPASGSAGNQPASSRGTPSTGNDEGGPIDLSDEFPPPPPDAASAGSAPRRVRLLNGKVLVDVTRLPILGQWDAKTVAIELFDYTCPHCRRTHRMLAEARQRYDGQLALAVIVTPMDPKCNPYVKEPAAATAPPPCDLARLSLAVWQTKPEAFEAYHDWMMDSLEIPTVESAQARAAEILGADKLEQALANPAIDQQLAANNRLYHLLGEGQIPKLLTDRLIVTGEPDDAGKLFDLLEKQNGLVP